MVTIKQEHRHAFHECKLTEVSNAVIGTGVSGHLGCNLKEDKETLHQQSISMSSLAVLWTFYSD